MQIRLRHRETDLPVMPVRLPVVTMFIGLMAVTYKAPEYVKSFTDKIVEAVTGPTFDATR